MEWEDDGRSMGLPKGNDAQAAILSREEYSKQKEQLVRKARGRRAMRNLQIHYNVSWVSYRM